MDVKRVREVCRDWNMMLSPHFILHVMGNWRGLKPGGMRRPCLCFRRAPFGFGWPWAGWPGREGAGGGWGTGVEIIKKKLLTWSRGEKTAARTRAEGRITGDDLNLHILLRTDLGNWVGTGDEREVKDASEVSALETTGSMMFISKNHSRLRNRPQKVNPREKKMRRNRRKTKETERMKKERRQCRESKIQQQHSSD